MTIEIDRVDWHPERAIAEVDHLASAGVERAGELIRERANEKVPYETGELASSATLAEHDGELALGYTDRVAVYVHAHPEWSFRDGRSGHWLEETLDASAGEVGAVMAESLRLGWPKA